MVRLIPMNPDEFEAYLNTAVQDYAQDLVRAGYWNAELAVKKPEETYHKLLPDDLASKNNYLFTIVEESLGEKVGILWFAVETTEAQSFAFVYDVLIDEAYRRHGYGMQAFEALEEKVRELGLATIKLHVFGHNRAARAMYAKLGYEETSVMMAKTLPT